MRLPSPELTPISESNKNGLKANMARLLRIGMGFFQPHESEMEELNIRLGKYRSKEISLSQAISNPRLARAFLYRYPSEIKQDNAISFDTDLLEVLWSHLSRRPNGLLATYFNSYRELPAYDELAQKLRNFYTDISVEMCPSLERKVKLNAEILFNTQGPKITASKAVERGNDIPSIEYEFGIPSDGGFHDEVLKWHYVYHVSKLPIGEVTECLKEASGRSICEQRLEDRLLGHALVKVMCQRCSESKSALPSSWLKIILRIAGDPRIGITMIGYQRWWASQDAFVIKMVKAALANRDIEYFLQALEGFADTEGGDMARMYRPRRKFLSGILETGAVKDALLILSRDAAQNIKRELPKDEQDYFSCSFLNDSVTRQCCIYLDVEMGHIIEGTHQSKFRIYDQQSQFACRIRDTRPSQISYSEIRRSDVIDDFIHHPPISWQIKAMRQLNRRFGIQVEPQKAFDAADYQEFIANYTLPY